MVGHALGDLGLGLYPTPNDVCTVLRARNAPAARASIDPEACRLLLALVRTGDGIPDIVRATATEVASTDSQLLAILDEMSSVTVPQWKIRRQRREAENRAKREAFCQSHRELHLEHATEIAAGSVDLLAVAADVYLGRSLQFRGASLPHTSVLEFLGEPLGARALDEFIAVLGRADLPSAREIAEAESHGKGFNVQRLLICGVAELLRRGQPLSAIDEDTLAAAYMAWQRSAKPGALNRIDIGEAITTVLFQSIENIERHFRSSIEPQLASPSGHVFGLYQFTREQSWRALAANLAVEWIGAYPTMPAHARRELMMCALAGPSQPTADALLYRGDFLPWPDIGALSFDLLALFVLDFDNRAAQLARVFDDNTDLIWLIRDLARWPGAQTLSRWSLSQLAFIVTVPGTRWPETPRPTGVTAGNTNAWDASEFIRSVIFSIAGNPAPEATDTLQQLVHGPAGSYKRIARRALAQQRQVHLDSEYAPPTVIHLQSVMTQGLPQSVDDMRAYLYDRLDTLQARMHAGNTDMWETFWANGKPGNETYCRNRLIDLISGTLPDPVRLVPEPLMPGQTRADIAAVRDSIGLPVDQGAMAQGCVGCSHRPA